ISVVIALKLLGSRSCMRPPDGRSLERRPATRPASSLAAAPHPPDVPFPCQRGPDLLTANPRVTYRRLHHAHSVTKEEVAEPIQVLRCGWERIYRSLRL